MFSGIFLVSGAIYLNVYDEARERRGDEQIAFDCQVTYVPIQPEIPSLFTPLRDKDIIGAESA